MDISNKLINSFNVEFCEFLEYHLSKTFKNSPDNKIKWLWCDGIKAPSIDNSTASTILNSQQIITTAFIGENGQDIYELVIKLGTQSLKACNIGGDLKGYLPSYKSAIWIAIDTELKEVILQLQ